MHGYGRFAALSNLEEEEDEREENEVDNNDVEEDVSSCGEYEAASLPVESCDATSERSLGLGHREMTTRSDSPGSDDPDDEAIFVSRT
jgi:hypothetical protein